MRHSGPTCLALFVVWICSAGAAAAQHGPAPVLNPKDYASPSGEYALHVDPTRPSGAGPAAYRLTRGGEEAWSAEHPFAFWSAAVTDEGVAAGFAYTGGIDRVGQLVLAILDPEGKVRMQEALPQEHSRFLHFPPVPRASDVFFHANQDRVVFRIDDPDINRAEETWRVFRASDGSPLGTLVPKSEARLEAARHIFSARPLPGTPLTLVHWFLYDQDAGRLGSMGGAFALVDLEGKPVWTQALPGDYEPPVGAERSIELRDRVAEHGVVSILPSAFEVWFVKEKQRVAFAVKPAEDEPGAWTVQETGRQPYDGPAVHEVAAGPEGDALARVDAAAREVEAVELEHLGTIRLDAGAAERPIRDVAEFDIDAQGRIGFIRREGSGGKERHCTLVLVNADGQVLVESSPDGFGAEGWWIEQVAWTGGDSWVITTSPLDQKAVAKAWTIDAATGETRSIEGFNAPRVEALRGAGDGGFVALVRQDFQYTSTEWVAAFGSDGRERWRVESEHGDPQKLFAPVDIATGNEGVVAVLSNIADDVKLFSREGKHMGTIALQQALGRDPNYPAGIATDHAGGWIIHDFNGEPPVWWLRQDQQVRASFQPRYEDGREFRLVGDVRPDPAGRLWTSDGHGLLQLDEKGVVAKVLGAPPEPQRLENIAGMTTDLEGRIYAVDGRTGGVHVFDPATGRRLRVLVPEATDFGDQLYLAKIGLDGEGSVYVGGMLGVERVKFNAAGERVGRVAPPVAGFITDWLFSPASTDQWVVRGLDSLVLIREREAERTLRRRPDGGWLADVHEVAVGRDGMLAITTAQQAPGSSPSGVHLFTRDGEPLRSMVGPVGHRLGLVGAFAVVPVQGEIYLYPLDGNGALRRFTPQLPQGAQEFWIPLIAPNNQELWLYAAGSFQVERYALPD